MPGCGSGLAPGLGPAPWPLLVLWGVYVVGVASRVRAHTDGVLVQNLLRTTFAPWARVRRIDMRWQIEIALDDTAKANLQVSVDAVKELLVACKGIDSSLA